MSDPSDEPVGAPQSPTTGRWELIARPKPPKRRWNEVPLWYRVLDRFGLPTLFAVALGAALWHFAGETMAAQERQNMAWSKTFDRLSDKIERVIFVPAPPPAPLPKPKPVGPSR